MLNVEIHYIFIVALMNTNYQQHMMALLLFAYICINDIHFSVQLE